MYGTDPVEGDTPTTASMLKAGDRVRSYSGFHDVVTILSNTRQIGQGGRYSHTITRSDGTTSQYVPDDTPYHLATGQPRDELGRFT